MDSIRLDSRREVCWDEYLIEKSEGVQIKMHKPEYRNVAFVADAPWEGDVCGYFTVMPDDGKLRMYYRGCRVHFDGEGNVETPHLNTYCYAESKDGGKTFERVNVDKISYWGTKKNNIIFNTIRDNIFFFKDTNPEFPADELYKALAEENQDLVYYKSTDGVNFEKVRVLADDGAYDTLNVSFWDDRQKKYFLYYRGLRGASAPDGKWTDEQYKAKHTDFFREVRVQTSKDFVHWDEPRVLNYWNTEDIYELYTNQVQLYYRAKHMFIGLPMRYIDRYLDVNNFYHLPDRARRTDIIRKWGRPGTAMTDAVIMTSRDGYNFRRTEEAFLTSGPERGTNWYYGDCNLSHGMFETASDIPGSPNEISIYLPVNYRSKDIEIYRYAIRLDGFFSWRGDSTEGELLTKPFCFAGDQMEINFSTSAVGYIQIIFLLFPDRCGS